MRESLAWLIIKMSDESSPNEFMKMKIQSKKISWMWKTKLDYSCFFFCSELAVSYEA